MLTHSRYLRWLVLALLVALALCIISIQLGQASLKAKQWSNAMLFPISSAKGQASLAADLQIAQKHKLSGDLARQALDASLSHVNALRSLGIAEYSAGNTKKGTAILSLAGQLSWRDGPTHAWLLNKAIETRDFESSIDHAETLLKRRRARNELFLLFSLMGQDNKLAGILSEKLAKNPDWRESYFNEAIKTPPAQYDGFEAISNKLQKTQAPPSPSEIAPYIFTLMQTQQKNRALRFWSKHFPKESLVLKANSSLNLKWPSGERQDKPYAIDWKVNQSRFLSASLDTFSTGDKNRLSVELEENALGNIASKPVLLSAGRLKLEASILDEDDNPDQSLRWYLKCSGSKSKASEITFQQSKDNPDIWTTKLPSSGCKIYDLTLAIRLGGITSEKSVNISHVKLSHIG